MKLDLNKIEMSVILLSLENARENCMESNGIGSYGGDVAEILISKIKMELEKR